MATISKFYLLDAASPNTGTMPSNSPTSTAGGVLGTGTEATGASTARDATDVAAASQQTSVITSQGTTSTQRLGHRRFVSRPLAAKVFAFADGSWTLSWAGLESNTNHSAATDCHAYIWRPSSGLQVGTDEIEIAVAAPSATTQAAYSGSGNWLAGGATAIDGDVLVIDIYETFAQAMATAYTSSFSYNGTTEASTTSCASFITPPAALTLFVPVVAPPDVYTARSR